MADVSAQPQEQPPQDDLAAFSSAVDQHVANNNAQPQGDDLAAFQKDVSGYSGAVQQPKEKPFDLYPKIDRIMSAFGENIKQTEDAVARNMWGDGGELVDSLKKQGMWQDYVKDQNDMNKGFAYKTAIPAIHDLLNTANEESVRLAAAAGNIGMGALGLVAAPIGQAIEELPLSDEMKEYAQSGAIFADVPHLGLPERPVEGNVFRTLSEGEASGIVGTTEGQNSGVEPLTDEQHIKQAVAQSEINPVAAAEIPKETSVPDVHDYARALDPEAFKKYDALQTTRETLRMQLDAMPDKNTAEYYDTRQKLQEANSQLRDLSPKVSDAYLQAQKIGETESIPNPETGVEPAPEMKEELANRENTVSPIVEDVAKQLQSVGRPEDEARASGEVAARMYQYFSDVYGGEKGTAQDWYSREGADIKAAKERATTLAQNGEETGELEQGSKGKLTLATKDANATIKLMKSADASTYLHEQSHDFLDKMERFSKEDGAPEELKADMSRIKKWVGNFDRTDISTQGKKLYKQSQEKFARGFERYLMEGVAPTRDMATVFAKFKKWMTDIYKTVLNIPDQRGGINEDIRSFFDKVMSRTPERIVIAPEKATDLKANISSPQLGELFGAVPKAPQTLTEYLADQGGIKPHKDLVDANKAHLGETYAVKKKGGGTYARTNTPFKRNLIQENGMDIGGYEGAAHKAWQAGYFPELGEERAPTEAEFLAKTNDDLLKNNVYSHKDQEALNNHKDALKYNAEVDKLSSDTGIETAGKTREQFYDEFNQHYEQEKRYNEAQEIASDVEEHYKDYEKQIKEFMDSRGDSWEPPKEPDAITEEEMWNEYKQGQAAHDAAGGDVNASEPVSATGVGEHGQEDIRQVGGGAGTNGGAGEGANSDLAANELAARQHLDAKRDEIANSAAAGAADSEPTARAEKPKSANESVGQQKSDYIDKAGNIRLDLLTDSNDVKAAMREAAQKNPQIFNHDVVTDAQVAEFADAMGANAKDVNIQKLRDISVNDDIPLAARIRSGSQMMVDSLNSSLELMKKANPTDEDAVKFLESKNKFMMIAETVSATTNEMGRAFRAYNNLMKEYNVKDIADITELFQRMTGRTLEDVKSEMQAGSLLKTPKQIARFANDSFKPNFMDKLIEYRNNSLLSGPVTHTMYTAGGFLNAAYKPIQTLAGLAIQGVRELAGADIEERLYAREALEQFHALGYGSMRGLKAAIESWKQNSEVALPTEIKSAPLLGDVEKGGLSDVKGTSGMGWLPRRQAIEGKLGTAINVPSRVIGSIHSFLKMLNYQQNLSGLAVREALEKGFDPASDEYAKFISDTIDSPSADMMTKAGNATLKEVYREKVPYNSTSGKLYNLINSNPVTKVLFPFIKMQYNIKRLAFRDNSVLGLFSKELRPDLSGVNGDVAQNMAIGKITAGTAVAGLGINMTMQGLNNGGGPSDPKAYKTWRLTHTPYSVQIGSLVIPHKALGTLGQLMGWAGDLSEGAHEFNPDDIEKSAFRFVRKSAAIFTEEGFLTQAKNTIDAAFTPEQFGGRFIQNFATQWLPYSVGFSQTNRLLNDPYSRRVKSLGAENLWGIPESMEYKYPGTSDLLQVNRDMFGRPITFESSYDQYANDPVVQKLESLQTGIGRLPDKIKGVQLNEQQYDDYSRLSGQMTYASLAKLVNMKGFDDMPPQHQLSLIEKRTSQSRLMASNIVQKMNPQIIRDAAAKKRLSIYGNKQVNDAESEQTEDVRNP